MAAHTHRELEAPPPGEPSRRLWTAAMAGLLGLGAVACGESKNKEEPDPTQVDAAVPDAPVDAASTKIISETPVQHTFAELKAMCDARGGYTEIYAACSGTNTCAGFSYGDWGEDAVLTEHSCNAVSGCAGMGCVVLPSDTAPGHGRSAVDILGAALPDTEGVAQRSCNYCHAEWSEDGSKFDATKFKVLVAPGSGRTLANWLDRPAETQARMLAFGVHGEYANGVQYGHMAAYYKLYSRAEIERVVDYIRTKATPVLKEIKVSDPPGFAPSRTTGPRRRRG